MYCLYKNFNANVENIYSYKIHPSMLNYKIQHAQLQNSSMLRDDTNRAVAALTKRLDRSDK